MIEPRTVVDRSTSRRFPCIPVADKHSTEAMFSDQELAQNWVVPHPPKSTFSKKTRARNRNVDGQNCFGSKRGHSAHTQSSSTGDEKQAFVDTTKIKRKKPPEWSWSISSSNSPESESNNTSKFESIAEKPNKFPNVGIWWVLVSLVVTVFWGKINVIILTSILGCFLSLWNASCCWIKEVPKLGNQQSKAYNNSIWDRCGSSGPNKQHF
ncbi:hypothetical protein VNO78_13922 [Psophocarpus tetragonolobus]|uniref:Uncharacterized protein n=1 Tax=Psophocarpus tetragonolobus TaxID=3891 RepID=A0AAN9SZE8_PSOTE